MFIEALLLSIIIGYILKGSIKRVNVENIKGSYIAFLSFGIEIMIFIPVRKGIISPGIITLLLYIVEYMLIFMFIYMNRKNKWILIMGIGFMLNAVAIFANGGLMPVSQAAIDAAGIKGSVSSEGLYTLVNKSTRLWFLGDVIPFRIFRSYVVSIGDLVSAIGLMIFMISGMRKTKVKSIML
ncbi:hypothetical protein OXPF_10190 [Oxobacter pfennigii]|uniref:DUF5317 domain-containing protein n=1 Tax=Oxobacter pfennigii TaxID=36849 RepID=A0A0N8NTU2_9CLOT|nr:DUF5317 domain-containing protein [Oxobacter pfennigii]KPU45784.1 hypothetical protein OXPF_10190 [Oxobacter pfennigii]